MILDAFAQFTGNTNATSPANVGNADGTDSPTTGAQTSSQIIDLHMLGIPVLANNQGARDLGIGDDPALKLNIQVTSTFAGGTSLIVTLQGATDNGSGQPATFNSWYASPTVLLANLIAGTQLLPMDVPRPPPGLAVPRFLQLAYTSAGTFTTTGGTSKLRGNIVLDRFDQMFNTTVLPIYGGYPAGVVVNN